MRNLGVEPMRGCEEADPPGIEQARSVGVKIKLVPLGNGDVQAEITNGRHGSSLLTGRRETVRKILGEQFPGVAIEDEGG
jgi:hypothetical protein